MLFAVHISDGVLATPWWVGGFALAGLLFYFGSLRLQDEEIPRIALLTAAFFIASLFHVRVPPTSVHLILNGLVGVVLGWRACLAIPVGLFLQVLLINHGGFTTLGVNTCVMVLPALLSYYIWKGLQRVPWGRRPWFRSLLVAVSCVVWTQSLIYSVTLLRTNSFSNATALQLADANAELWEPWTWCVAGAAAFVLVMVERRLETAPEFPLGLLIGELAVLGTLGLNCFVLMAGGAAYWQMPAVVWVIVHLPIAVIEGVVLGFAVGFLARVKPEMLGIPSETCAPVVREPSSNGNGRHTKPGTQSTMARS
jgi:cobalt/nickel transport system permease protein